MGRQLTLILKATRPNQWNKQILILLPLIFLGREFTLNKLIACLLGAIAFNFVAMSVYLINDLSDIENDKFDILKQQRPLASGELSPNTAKILIPCLLFCSFIILLQTKFGPASYIILISYLFLNFLYSSFSIKNHSILGMLIVASGFSMRWSFGVSILNLETSWWAIILIMQIALFLLSGKRFQSAERKKIANDSLIESEKNFWLLIMVIYGALFLSTYGAFISQPATQAHWGLPTVLISSIIIGVGLVRYLEITVSTEWLYSSDSTEVLVKDRFLIAIGFIFIFILILGRLDII